MKQKVYKDESSGEWVIVPPRGEYIWVTYYGSNGSPEYFITSKDIRDFYYLYVIKGDIYDRTWRGKSPLELEEKYHK